MIKEVDMIIKSKFDKQYKSGSPLITKESLININKLNEEGMLCNLYYEDKSFAGKGYYGKQNKGYGWILSKDINVVIDEKFFYSKIKEAILYREEFFKDEETTAFRVFSGEGDGIGGLTIDYFAGYYMITWYSLGIFQFSEDIIKALLKATEVKGLYQKKRFNTEGKYVEGDDFIWGEEAPVPYVVKENGVKFAVYLNDGPMVGVFLDQREVRRTIKDKYSEGRSVINLFSYTGAFSVFALKGGATKTTNVDLANRSRAKTKEQFELNGIDADSQEIIVEDVFNYFKYATKKEKTFDLVILDPPSFARSKKHRFSVSKDYPELLMDAIQLTNVNGIIVASTNYSGFNMNKFKQFIDIAFNECSIKYKIKEEFTLPKDFKVNKNYKEGDYLKVVFVQRLS